MSDWPRDMKRASDHDPLCHAANIDYHDPDCCDCDLIAKVRADERERIAQAIDAHAQTARYWRSWSRSAVQRAAFSDAAAIALRASNA